MAASKIIQKLAGQHSRVFRKEFEHYLKEKLTLSMGATAVLEMAAEIPPAKKSLANEIAVSLIVRCS